MKKIFLSNLLFLVIFFIANDSFGQKQDLKLLDNYIQNACNQWNIPGLAIAIVKDNKVIFSKGYGIREFGKPEKITDETLFAIASNTKAFTATAIALLAEQGKLKLDDPVQNYLPWFELYDPYVSSKITVRDLLCHRSGLKTFSGDLVWYGTSHSRKEVLERARHLKPSYGFREKYGYSNIMFLAAGEIIPVVTGNSWEQFIRENFFIPLGMLNSNLSIKDFKSAGNIAQPHHVAPGQNPVVVPYVNWDNIGPAGSINSNVKEMSEWIKMNLNNGTYNGKQIISEQFIRQLRNIHIARPISKWSEENFPSKHYSGYGLGWDLFDYHGRNVINHGGGADGMISQVVLVPSENIGFVVLTNSINSLPSALMYYILDFYFAKPDKDWSSVFYKFYVDGIAHDNELALNAEKIRMKNTIPSLQLTDYAGIYRSKLYGDAKLVVEGDKLVLYFLPTSAFVGDLSHYQLNTFRISLRNQPSLPSGTVNFLIDAKARVFKMEVDIPNPDFDFTELEFLKTD